MDTRRGEAGCEVYGAEVDDVASRVGEVSLGISKEMWRKNAKFR